MYNLPGCLLLTPCPHVPNSRMRGALKPSLPMRETRLPKEDKENSNQTKPNQTSMGRRPENSKSKANPSEESGGKSRWKNKTSEGNEERNQEPTPDKPSNWVFRCEKKIIKVIFAELETEVQRC